MSTPCDSLQAFADGELPPTDAQAFGMHLAECERCQTELTRLLQLEQLGRRYLERHGPVEVPWHAIPRNRWLAAGAAVLSAVAVLLLLIIPRFTGGPTSRAVPELWARQQRTLEARVTYPAADTYHPMVQSLMGAANAPSGAEVSHAVMGQLEKWGDLPQLVAAYLAGGTPDTPRAKQLLERMRRERTWDANVLCDLGVAHYVDAQAQQDALRTGELREALRLFNEVLRGAPTHVQARWNRALVYRDLGLPLLAMEDFAALERTETDAQWRNEAREKRKRLEGVLQRKANWEAADTAGFELISRGVPALTEALRYADVPLMRRDFYHAVRARTSAAEVRAFLPLASTLDGLAGGGTVLQEYVQRIAARNFSVRASLAAQYARLMTGQVASGDEEALLRTFLASGEDDIALGALTYAVPHLPQYTRQLLERTRTSPDPWFRVLGLQVEATQEQKQERYDRARKLLEEALDLCKREQLVYRCVEVENDLSHVSGWLFHVSEAERHARAGLAMARRAQWDQERTLLQTLGNAMRMAADVTLGRAYFGEALLMSGGDRTSLRNIHQNLAHLAIQALELDEARAELDRAVDVGLPLTQHGIEALVDVARIRRSPRDAQIVEQALAREPGNTPGQRAYTKLLQGRFLVEVDPIKGRALLEEAIHEAESAAPEDITARHARAYSYTSLIFADAARSDFAAALERFGTELGLASTGRCVLALTEDTERSLLVARGAEGQLVSRYIPQRSTRFDPASLAGVVPPDMVDALRPCASVDVLARPPLQGRSGLLPSEFAWRYLTRPTAPRPPDGRGLHVVVREVRYNEQHNDPVLTWSPSIAPGAELRTLRELDATPNRVLAAMSEATDIDLATHGKIDPGSNTAYLLLAPGPDGNDALYENRIRGQRLSGAPLVVLAACEAARGTSSLHEQGSLPNAFLAAGARTVLAATLSIPNDDASAFFAAVRERSRGGVPASVAARDERMKWLNGKKDAEWVNGVLVFE
ncbi:CHAT domain-containing protein [Vitiosangium sp. GDMCC 1.1324]|uniref:CHAT domain-containing protein n=1 Tax=Vitiosangium sp. (strain GDMCC 1.1324) TaxID=2138576 RepID=UPI001E2DDB35|nr:CHAT domain-containing protein [Vitiosangium sp. GDMCC 1.1324]